MDGKRPAVKIPLSDDFITTKLVKLDFKMFQFCFKKETHKFKPFISFSRRCLFRSFYKGKTLFDLEASSRCLFHRFYENVSKWFLDLYDS